MTTPNFICLSNNAVLKMQNHCTHTFSVFAGFLAGLSFPVQWTNRLQSPCDFFFSEHDQSTYSYESGIHADLH